MLCTLPPLISCSLALSSTMMSCTVHSPVDSLAQPSCIVVYILCNPAPRGSPFKLSLGLRSKLPSPICPLPSEFVCVGSWSFGLGSPHLHPIHRPCSLQCGSPSHCCLNVVLDNSYVQPVHFFYQPPQQTLTTIPAYSNCFLWRSIAHAFLRTYSLLLAAGAAFCCWSSLILWT